MPEENDLKADIAVALSEALGKINLGNTANVDALVKIEELPLFYSADPEFWFMTLESQFSLRGIKSDEIKFKCIVARPPKELCLYIKAENADITPLEANQTRYQRFKERVIRAFRISEDAKLKQLIRAQPIAADKPSQILVQLQSLAGSAATPAFIRNVFLEQLPDNVRPILAATQIQDVNKLAEIADSIVENTSSQKFVCAVSESEAPDWKTLFELQKRQLTAQLNQDKLIESMSETLKTLVNQVEKLQRFRSRSRSRPRSSSVFKKQNQEGVNIDYCRFHNKFGEAAYRCEHPCAYQHLQKNADNH